MEIGALTVLKMYLTVVGTLMERKSGFHGLEQSPKSIHCSRKIGSTLLVTARLQDSVPAQADHAFHP